jgi:hypothetical protein
MLKKLFLFLLICSCLSCDKLQQKSACGTQVCTAIFTIIGIHFTDKTGQPIGVQNFSAINQRTHLKLVPSNTLNSPTALGYYLVADDSMKDQLSTDGDDVVISATDPTTNQTKTVTFKLTGGCNCHVGKLSGVETVAFD